MSGIEALVILPVAPLYLAVMSWRIRPDQFVADAVTFQMHLKKSRSVAACGKAVGELRTIVRLDTFDRAGEGFHKVLKKHGGGIGALFFKSLHKAPSGILINGGILEEMFSDDPAVDKAGGGNNLHIDLEALSGVVHLLIRFGDILGVRRMERHDALFFEETVQPGNGTGIAALHEFNPENNETGMWISSAHISDKLYLGRGMLVRMVVWPAGESAQGLNGAVITPFPAVDVLPVGLVFNGSVSDTIFFSIFDKG